MSNVLCSITLPTLVNFYCSSTTEGRVLITIPENTSCDVIGGSDDHYWWLRFDKAFFIHQCLLQNVPTDLIEIYNSLDLNYVIKGCVRQHNRELSEVIRTALENKANPLLCDVLTTIEIPESIEVLTTTHYASADVRITIPIGTKCDVKDTKNNVCWILYFAINDLIPLVRRQGLSEDVVDYLTSLTSGFYSRFIRKDDHLMITAMIQEKIKL